MVELGIFKGGSSVLYEALFQPHRLVAIERDATPVAALEAYRSSHGLDGVILPNYGVDQGDAEALEAVLAANFGARTLDLVIDDASHRYHPTKTSLNVLMKWLRPGGVFVLEDWGWAHWVGHTWQGPDPYLSGDLWLSNLAFELAMISASRPDLITALTIKPSVLAFTRGDGVVDADFDISTSYLTRGEGFELLGRPARHSSRTRWRRLAASIRAGRGSGPG